MAKKHSPKANDGSFFIMDEYRTLKASITEPRKMDKATAEAYDEAVRRMNAEVEAVFLRHRAIIDELLERKL